MNHNHPSHHAKSLPGLRAIFKEAWSLFKENLRTLVSINLVPMVFGFLYLSFLPSILNNAQTFEGFLLILVWFVLSIIIQTVSQAALLIALIHNQTFVPAYKKAWNIALSFFWVDTLVMVRVILGLLLLIIPGIYFLIKYMFASFTLIEEGKRGMEALSVSSKYVKGTWWKWFSVYFVCILASVVVVIVVSGLAGKNENLANLLSQLVSLVLTPFIVCVLYVSYKHAKSHKN